MHLKASCLETGRVAVPPNQYHFDNAPPICNKGNNKITEPREDYVNICTGYNLM